MKIFAPRSRIVLFIVMVSLLVLVSADPLQATQRPVNGSDVVAAKTPAQEMPTDAQIAESVREMLPGLSIDGPMGITVSCQILDSSGTPVTSINTASFGSAANWFYYISDGQVSNTVNFWARPYYSPVTLKTVFQSFNVTTSPTTDIVTPFAIPYWGGLTRGVWILVVYNELLVGNYCVFTVV